MLTTYHGILRGDRIEWDQDSPKDLRSDHPIPVFVTILDEDRSAAETKERGEKMFEALEKLAAAGGIASIPDPLAWEREQRKDRPLPGRPD